MINKDSFLYGKNGIIKLKEKHYDNNLKIMVFNDFKLIAPVISFFVLYIFVMGKISEQSLNWIFCLVLLAFLSFPIYGVSCLLWYHWKNKKIEKEYLKKINEFYEDNICVVIIKDCKDYLDNINAEKKLKERLNNIIYRISQKKLTIEDMNFILWINEKKEKDLRTLKEESEKAEALEVFNEKLMSLDQNFIETQKKDTLIFFNKN